MASFKRKPDIQQVAISSRHLKNSALKLYNKRDKNNSVKTPCSVVSMIRIYLF